jgi:hypothetical protein
MTEKSKLTEELMREYGLSDEPAAPAPAPSGSLAPAETVVPISSGSVNPFVDLKRRQEEELKKQPPKNEFERNPEITGLGALLGGMAQYKGVGQNLFRPDPNLFVATNPDLDRGKIGVSPSATGEPMSTVQHTMQSGQGKMPGVTGREREGTHNLESQRQSWATEQGTQAPGAKQTVVQAGPMVTNKAGFSIPLNTAMSLEEQLTAKQKADIIADQQIRQKVAETERRFDEQKAKRTNVINAVKGATQGTRQMGQGIVGGAIAAPALYEYGRDALKKDVNKPADTTQLTSGIGGLMMALGKGKLGTLGALAQIPYAVKHRDELARSQMLSDVVPDTMRMGMTGAEMYEPAGTMPVKPFPINDGRR